MIKKFIHQYMLFDLFGVFLIVHFFFNVPCIIYLVISRYYYGTFSCN